MVETLRPAIRPPQNTSATGTTNPSCCSSKPNNASFEHRPHFDRLRGMQPLTDIEAAERLIMAMLWGPCSVWNGKKRRYPAGVRTYMLVCGRRDTVHDLRHYAQSAVLQRRRSI